MTDLATQEQPNFFDHYRKLGRRLMKRPGTDSAYAPPVADEQAAVAETLDQCAAAPIAPEPEVEAVKEPSVTKRILSRNTTTAGEPTDHAAAEELVASLRRRSRTAADDESAASVQESSIEEAATTEADTTAEPMELPALRVAQAEAPLEGVDDIYNNVRALVRTSSPARVVFAGASEGDAARSVVLGIAEHACRRGQRVVMAELLDPSGRTLLVRLATPNSDTSSAPLLELDLHGLDARERISQWLERELPDTDLLLIAGPALADSVDSALLASACDGLIIVAESGVTDREAIATAAERAQVTHAPTLGVVVDGTRDRLPAWLRRWIPGRRNTLTPTYTDAR